MLACSSFSFGHFTLASGSCVSKMMGLPFLSYRNQSNVCKDKRKLFRFHFLCSCPCVCPRTLTAPQLVSFMQL